MKEGKGQVRTTNGRISDFQSVLFGKAAGEISVTQL
jgi:hypothetical protein